MFNFIYDFSYEFRYKSKHKHIYLQYILYICVGACAFVQYKQKQTYTHPRTQIV